MRFVPAVDLPVPVQAARVCQLLPANLASHSGLPVRANLTSSEGEKWSRSCSTSPNFEQLLFDLCKKETGLTYIEHNVSCVGNKKTTFRKDNGYTDIMIVKRIHLKTSIKASPRSKPALTYLMPPIGCFSDFGVCFESRRPLMGGGLCLPAFNAAQAMPGPRFWPRGACNHQFLSQSYISLNLPCI